MAINIQVKILRTMRFLLLQVTVPLVPVFIYKSSYIIPITFASFDTLKTFRSFYI